MRNVTVCSCFSNNKNIHISYIKKRLKNVIVWSANKEENRSFGSKFNFAEPNCNNCRIQFLFLCKQDQCFRQMYILYPKNWEIVDFFLQKFGSGSIYFEWILQKRKEPFQDKNLSWYDHFDSQVQKSDM